MPPRCRRWVLCLGAVLSLPGCGESGPVPLLERHGRSATALQLLAQVQHVVAAKGEARVLVNLAPVDDGEIAAAQQRVLAALGDAFAPVYVYRHVPALAGALTAEGLDRLLAWSEPAVASVQLDEPGSGHLAETVALIGASTVHGYGWTGASVRVAVLDSGIDTDHPDLADDLVAQQCFTNGDCPPGDTDQSASAEDEHGHGTLVSGIISSKGTVSSKGVAPDAEIVAVRVLDSNNVGPPSQWVAGLDWVLANLATLKVKVVNMSLGSWTLYSGNCDAAQPALAAAVSKLVAQGVVIFASTGNDASSTSITAPACISGVIGVGATYDADLGRQPPTGTYPPPASCFDQTSGPAVVACFANTNAQVDLVAPGALITSTALGGTTGTYKGTSLAAPAAAAAAALLADCNPGLTPAQIETVLEQTGTAATDAKNGLGFPALNVLAAFNAVCACAGKPDGTACDDGDLCTQNDSCLNESCASGTPVTCTAAGPCHLPGSCDPSTGSCTASPPKPPGTACDDSDPCTQQDSCDAAGTCSGTAYTCPAAGPCLVAACDGQGGCTTSPGPDGATCDDGDPCTQNDACLAGVCTGAPLACVAVDECHDAGTCDPQTGACTTPTKPDGSPCSLGTCVAGSCVPGPDAGPPDAATPDGGLLDTGASDAGEGPPPAEAGLPTPDSHVAPPPPDSHTQPTEGSSGAGDGCSCALADGPAPADPLAASLLLLAGLGLALRRRTW